MVKHSSIGHCFRYSVAITKENIEQKESFGFCQNVHCDVDLKNVILLLRVKCWCNGIVFRKEPTCFI